MMAEKIDQTSINPEIYSHLFKYVESYYHANNQEGIETSSTVVPPIDLEIGGPVLEYVASAFNLTEYEIKIILLCTGVQLDTKLARLCGKLLGVDAPHLPTVELALMLFQDAYWGALSPSSPLRYWQLITLIEAPLHLESQLRIDEWLVNFLCGNVQLDARILKRLETVPLSRKLCLAPSQSLVTKDIGFHWFNSSHQIEVKAIQLLGTEYELKNQIISKLSDELQYHVYRISLHDIQIIHQNDLDFFHFWNRETCLNPLILYIQTHSSPLDSTTQQELISSLCLKVHGFIVIESEDQVNIGSRGTVHVDIKKPTYTEQCRFWHKNIQRIQKDLIDIMGWSDTNDSMRQTTDFINVSSQRMSDQFSLNYSTITDICNNVSAIIKDNSQNFFADYPQINEEISAALWEEGRRVSRPMLKELAQKIEPTARFDNLILSPDQHAILRNLCTQGMLRSVVYQQWGFAQKQSRGLGISVIFSGPSGTGKTTAAEVIANELSLDLYRIDLSNMISKYIGETEKHLKKVFDAAENCGAILLFDEADAIFGKRTEVKEGRDRHSNQEVSYLLQRIETFRGIAILTTNFISSIDTAFIRRMRLILEFDIPNPPQRSEIWRSVFPINTPLDSLDYDKLSKLTISGGSINNIAVAAAFFAAEQKTAISMGHIGKAVVIEYEKLKRHLTPYECDDWIELGEI